MSEGDKRESSTVRDRANSFPPRLLRPLRHRPFVLLWSGQSLSTAGNAVTEIALAWLVYDLTGSPLEMGAIMALFNLPFVSLVLAGGIVADRFPRRTVMLVSDAARCLLVAATALLVAEQAVTIWHLRLLALATGSAAAFFFPAQSSVLPDLVPADDLLPANSLDETSRWVARIAGPMLGALLVAAGGLGAAFAFDAATFGCSALLLLRIRPLPVRSAGRRSSLRRDLAEGFRAVSRSTWLWFSISLFALIGAFDEGAVTVVLPKLVIEQLGGEVATLGAIRAAMSAGLAAGAVYVGQRGMPRLRGPWLYGATAISGLSLSGLALSFDPVLGASLGLLYGAMWGIVLAIWATSLQDLVPFDLRGRVRSIDALGSYSLLPVGTFVAGLAAGILGASAVLLSAGLAVALLASGALLQPSIRRFGAEGVARTERGA